jgi:UDP-2-acetamido-3-amino-2,3-dideoxy-glucuronate N-acetyltransferase
MATIPMPDILPLPVIGRETARRRNPVIDPSAQIHATADLEADVSIGPGTSVWHHAQIRRGARIGRDVVIGRDVFIDESVVLGDRVKVQNRALVYHGVTVEDGVFIGPGAILTNDRRPRSLNADGSLARAADWTVSPIRIAVGASIGAGAVVVAGRDVGPYAMVGAGAVVTHDVPGHALVVGNPARQIGWVCICGDRLIEMAGDEAGSFACPACGRRYDRADADGALVVRAAQADTQADGSGPHA